LHKDFTRGNILGHLIRFGAPFLLSSFLQALYNVTDMAVVGHFSTTEALAGVTNGGQITNVVVMVVAGLTVGGTVLVGQYFGAKREKDVSETIGTLFTVLALAAARSPFSSSRWPTDPPDDPVPEKRHERGARRTSRSACWATSSCSAITRFRRCSAVWATTPPLIFVAIAAVVNAVLDVWMVKGTTWARRARLGDHHRAGRQRRDGGGVPLQEQIPVRLQVAELHHPPGEASADL
jgi:hypothetical protein